MAFSLPPPPVGNDVAGPAFRDWFYKLVAALQQVGTVDWDDIVLPVVGPNEFFGGPVSGSGTAGFRTLELADFPSDLYAFIAAYG